MNRRPLPMRHVSVPDDIEDHARDARRTWLRGRGLID